MAQKKITLEEALTFAKENGYVFAVYEKKDDVYVLFNKCYLSDIDEDTEIIVKTNGFGTNFNRFMTVDGQYCFVLHNTFNVPETIPVPSEGVQIFPL